MITLLFALLLQIPSHSQTHDVDCVNCRYWKRPEGVKGIVNDFCVCEGCRANREQEIKARKEEDDRRNALIAAKQKAEREERERQEAKRKLEEAEREKRRQENLARAQEDIATARRRAEQLKGRYSNLHKVSGTKYEAELEDLDAYNTSDYYGVQLSGELLWRQSNDGIPTHISKVEGTNFFTLKVGNKLKLINLYGEPILVGGDEWFDLIIFNKKYNRFEFSIYDKPFERVHKESLTCSGSKTVEMDAFYSSMQEILDIHEANVAIDKACWEAYWSTVTSENARAIVRSSYIHTTSGEATYTDIEFNILSTERGYFARYGF